MQQFKRAYLVLEGGTIFKGYSMGAEGVTVGEVVFNTCTASYEELLTDPTYYGQIVAQTYPLVGNRGMDSNGEKLRTTANGYIAREWCDTPTDVRGGVTLDTYLKERGIVGICGIDTRRLTRILRNKGYYNGAITNTLGGINHLMERIKSYSISGAVKAVTTQDTQRVTSENGNYEVAVMDYGFSRKILEPLVKRGVNFTVYPAFTDPRGVLSTDPDGIFLSDGPGDPDDSAEIIANIKVLAGAGKPILGFGLGHQMLAHALGGCIEKMEKGHRGSNQPVRILESGKIMITTQNHGYAVKKGVIPETTAEIIMENVNDGTIEGLRYKTLNALTIQFDPQDGTGFQDSAFIFDMFVKMLEEAGK